MERQHLRLERYEDRTSRTLVALALGFLVVYAVPILWPSSPEGLLTACEVANLAIWAVFVVDLATRAWLSGAPGGYVVRHPIDVLLVVVPMLRPLRALRVFTAGSVLVGRGKRLDLPGVFAAIAAASALLIFIGALAALDAERGAPDATIVTFGDAVWWAGTTITTVGYGDTYPVTGTGRAVAFALMLLGISLLGVVTATVAAWFVQNVSGGGREVELEAEVARLRAELDERT